MVEVLYMPEASRRVSCVDVGCREVGTFVEYMYHVCTGR